MIRDLSFAYIILSSVLFCIGVLGVLLRRNTIIILMCIELMLNAVNLLLVSSSLVYQTLSAQIMVFFVMIVAAAEVSVGLAIVSVLYKKSKAVDVDHWHQLKG